MNKNKKDGRKLKPETLQEFRNLAIKLYKKGVKQKEIAEIIGMSLSAIKSWIKIYKIEGLKGLILKNKGVKVGTNRKLNFEKEEFLKQLIIDKNPEEIGLNYNLWTRRAIQLAVNKLLNIFIPLRTVSHYMKRFGFTVQKPLKEAYEQKPKETEKWKKKKYPEIKKKAKKENAEIHWVDETGLRSTGNYVRGFSPKGKTPIIRTTGKRFRINLISSVTNQGKMRFMTFKDSMNSEKLIEFMYRLLKNNKRKVFVILDNLRVHHSKHFTSWLENKKEKIEVFYLPSYSPNLNPDERLNRDLKTNFYIGSSVKNNIDFRKKVISFLKSIQRLPERIKKYFISKYVKYAA